MEAPKYKATRNESASLLRRSYAALRRGDRERAREFAQGALSAAKVSGAHKEESRALLRLAQCDFGCDRFERARETAEGAARLSRSIGDLDGEVRALTVLAEASCSLGYNENAVEAALLATRLGTLLPMNVERSWSYCVLGTAYAWCRSFEKADIAFEEAARAAQTCRRPAAEMHARMYQMTAEALRLFTERCRSGVLPSLRRMRSLEAALLGVGAGLPRPLKWGGTARAITCVVFAQLQVWQGHADRARDLLATLDDSRTALPTWVAAIRGVVFAELALGRGDLADAEARAVSVIELATTCGHEQIACLGHSLLTTVLEARGQPGRALEELRRLSRRERRIRARSLESSERSVDWQLELRRRERDLISMQEQNGLLLEISCKDPLTGIANRRRLEQRLAQMLKEESQGGQTLAVVLIDINDFGDFNKRYSYATGDAVLKAIADMLVTQVREGDLVARLGGDEFVLVLRRTDAISAQQVCERIERAAAERDWGLMTTGLRVGVSVGYCTAVPGDSVADLLHRSDAAMLARKREHKLRTGSASRVD